MSKLKTEQEVTDLLELSNLYPSPHNGQPIRLKLADENLFEIYFDRQRGLRAADVSYVFSFVSMGVFIEHLAMCAQALGDSFTYKLELPSEKELHGEGLVKIATCYLDWNSTKPDIELRKALQFRQTSRKKYFEGLDSALTKRIEQVASEEKVKLVHLSKDKAKQAIWLNQRAVFDDLFDEPVRQELNHWMRYTKQDKYNKKDGLSYDCMELNGQLMHYIINHPKIIRAPIVSQLLKQYYLRTMADSSDVFYMLAPFGNELNCFHVGQVVMKIWMEIARNGYYLHPFGTIMTNHRAHQDFIRLAGVNDESRAENYLVFIFRAGKSEQPHASLRLGINEHLLIT